MLRRIVTRLLPVYRRMRDSERRARTVTLPLTTIILYSYYGTATRHRNGRSPPDRLHARAGSAREYAIVAVTVWVGGTPRRCRCRRFTARARPPTRTEKNDDVPIIYRCVPIILCDTMCTSVVVVVIIILYIIQNPPKMWPPRCSIYVQ